MQKLSHFLLRKTYLFFIFVSLCFTGCQRAESASLQTGDIIFHTSTSAQSQAVQLATKSKYSHMGMVYEKEGKLYVLEAVQPVKFTPLNEWIKRGKNGQYVVKRLKNSKAILTPQNIIKIKQEGKKYLGKNYDIYFEWSDERMYCSELVWKIYKNVLDIEIGNLQKISEFNLSHPTVKAKLKERFGDNIPMNQWAISPDQMFRSDLLETVDER
ncbi:MAG: YiiX family permuted papain-like enzyme [Azoarcus sp.]|jgi:hypothetical protein|nr:YiiX family permuted papain-like enzyme [Azoarcus sp.]